jgi:hypothetical protein
VGSADAREQPDEKQERQSNGSKVVGANRAQACRPGEQQDGEEWDELIRPKQSGHSEYQTGLNHEAQLQAIHGSDSNAVTLYWNAEEAARGNYESNTVEANLCRQKISCATELKMEIFNSCFKMRVGDPAEPVSNSPGPTSLALNAHFSVLS